MKKNKLPSHPNTGFKVPDNYFQDLEARIMSATYSKDHLNSPGIKETGFRVPDNYFEDLQAKVMQKVQEPQKDAKLIPLFSREKFYYAAAIAAAVILIFSTVLLKPVGEQEFSMETIEVSALEEYINNGHLDFNFNEISTFLSEEDYIVEEMNVSGLSDEEVFRYINENVENPDLLLD